MYIALFGMFFMEWFCVYLATSHKLRKFKIMEHQPQIHRIRFESLRMQVMVDLQPFFKRPEKKKTNPLIHLKCIAVH